MSQDLLPTQALFSTQAGADVGAMFAILIGAIIAAGGGLGGGGVFVPIYILILQYPPKFAAALSQATICGGSIVNLVMNYKKRHPTRKHRPLTDFPTLLIFEPMLLIGTILGVLFNVIFPDILILILLALVLVYATIRTTKKGVRLWKKETDEFKNEAKNESETTKVNVETKDVETPTKDVEASPTDAETAVPNGIDKQHDDNDPNPVSEDNVTVAITDEPIARNDIDITVAVDVDVDVATETKQDIDNDVQSANDPSLSDEEDPEKRPSLVPLVGLNDNTANTRKIVADPSQSEITKDTNTDDDINALADGCGVEPSQITKDKVDICKEFIERESQITQPYVAILCVWFFVSLFAILRKSVVECSAGYWVLTFLPFPIMIGVSHYMTKREYDYYQVKVNSECWVPAFGDIKLEGDFVRILKYPLIASIAGVLGGLLGIGGGMIVSPLLIELGVIPTVAAATSAMAVMITSSSAMVQFLLLGFLQWDYTLFFMIIGIVGTYIGQTAVNHAVKEYGRVSVVIIAVATVMALAIILMTINGLIELVEGVSWGFAPPC